MIATPTLFIVTTALFSPWISWSSYVLKSKGSTLSCSLPMNYTINLNSNRNHCVTFLVKQFSKRCFSLYNLKKSLLSLTQVAIDCNFNLLS